MSAKQWLLVVRFMFWTIYSLNRISPRRMLCEQFEYELDKLRNDLEAREKLGDL